MKSVALALLLLVPQVISASNNRELPYFENKDLTPYWPAENKSFVPAKVEAFKAIRQDESSVTHKNFKGQLSLVNFFFVQCPGICPMMMKNVQNMQKAMGDQKDNVHIYSFSVQPQADTPERLRSYAKSYEIELKNWTLLTGEKKEIYNVGKNMFKADGAVGDQKSDESFIHTQNLYLVDQSLKIRGIYDTSDPRDMGQLREDIAILHSLINK